jgi:hypothetical protein
MIPDRVVITIDHLTVAGLEARDGERFGRVFGQELTRLVQDRGVPSGWRQGGHAPAVRLPNLPHAARRSPEHLGRALAGALYETLNRPPELAS